MCLLAACGEAPEPPAAPVETSAVEPAETPDLTSDQQRQIAELESLGYLGGHVAVDPERPGGVTLYDRDRAQPGLNFLVSAHDSELLLLDMEGRTLHHWRCDFAAVWPDRRGGSDRYRNEECFRRARLLPDGRVLAIWEGLGLVELDRDSRVLWSYDGNAHHDLDVDAAGRIYVLTREASVLPRFNEEQPILEDFVTVLSPDGEELRSVSLIECYENSDFRGPLEIVPKAGDVFHTNTLELLDGRHTGALPEFTAGRVLLSLRRPGVLAVCDLDQRRIVWSITGPWRLQHEPSMLDDGHLLLFDNQGKRRRSGVLEIDPATVEVVWEYRREEKDTFYSASCGTAHRLANGDTLIAESEPGRAFEITPEGDVVWRYESPYRWKEGDEEFVATLYDVQRIAPEFVADWLGR